MLPVKAKEWAWYPWESDGWNTVHQAIFRQGRLRRLDACPASVPPLPASVPVVPRVDRDDVGTMRSNASLMKWIGVGRMPRTAFVLLEEDRYESTFGDGVFRDFVGCYPDKAAALRRSIGQGMQRHVRRIKLSVRGGCVTASPERKDFADRYDVQTALANLVKRLGRLT